MLASSWKNARETLHSVCGSLSDAGEIKKIQLHCRKLRNIHIDSLFFGRSGFNEAVVKCLASYGKQLEHVHLDCDRLICPPHYMDEWPNAQFSICTGSKDLVANLADILSRAGPRIVEANVAFSDLKSSEEELRCIGNAWDSVMNVKKLKFIGVNMKYVASVFNAPKVHLEHLDICFGVEKRGESNRQGLLAIASGTTGLRTLKLRSCLPKDIDLDSLRQIVLKNPMLRKATIRVLGLDENIEFSLNLLATLLKAKELQEVELGYFGGFFTEPSRIELQSFCDSFRVRERRLTIRVMCHDYLK